jgi:hypothetical protein
MSYDDPKAMGDLVYRYVGSGLCITTTVEWRPGDGFTTIIMRLAFQVWIPSI